MNKEFIHKGTVADYYKRKCERDTQPKTSDKWEEEFDKMFTKLDYNGADEYINITGAYENVINFISRLLQKQKQEIIGEIKNTASILHQRDDLEGYETCYTIINNIKNK